MTLNNIKSNLFSYTKIIKELKEKYPNINTQNTKIVEIINILKKSKSKKAEKALGGYRNRLIEIANQRTDQNDKQEASVKEKENYMSLDEMKEKWKEIPYGVDKLMIGFYIFYPPLRSDWCCSSVENGFFVFDKFVKRKEGNNQGDLKKPIVPQLKPLLVFMDEIPRNNNSFVKRLGRITKKYFDKSISINLFRKIWVFENKDKSLTDRKELAKNMNHTIDVQESTYKKLDLNID